MGILWPSAAVALLMAQALASTPGGTPPRVIKAETYPEKCVRHSERIETVTVNFDTTAMGEPLNASIVTSTNSCLNDAALDALAQSRFLNTGENAGLNPRKNLRASLVFDRIISPEAPEREFRRSVRNRLNRVLRELAEGGDPAEALERLDDIEQKYGDKFSLAEFAAHRVLRAAARSEDGDVKGALIDLRDAEKTGVMDVTTEITGRPVSEIREELQKAE